MRDAQSFFERQILKKFKKLLAGHDVSKIDAQLHAYLVMVYGFSKIKDLNEFRKEYAGINGFRRFIIHFIRPAADWHGPNAKLNKQVYDLVINNVGEYLRYCTEQEKLKETVNL